MEDIIRWMKYTEVGNRPHRLLGGKTIVWPTNHSPLWSLLDVANQSFNLGNLYIKIYTHETYVNLTNLSNSYVANYVTCIGSCLSCIRFVRVSCLLRRIDFTLVSVSLHDTQWLDTHLISLVRYYGRVGGGNLASEFRYSWKRSIVVALMPRCCPM